MNQGSVQHLNDLHISKKMILLNLDSVPQLKKILLEIRQKDESVER